MGNVAVRSFGTLLKLLRRGRRYASSGAIAGPIVELDMRDTYLVCLFLRAAAEAERRRAHRAALYPCNALAVADGKPAAVCVPPSDTRFA